MTLIMFNEHLTEFWIYQVADKAGAKYVVQRRVEKDGFDTARAYLVDETNEVPAVEWVKEYHELLADREKERSEITERQEFIRLYKKFGGPIT